VIRIQNSSCDELLGTWNTDTACIGAIFQASRTLLSRNIALPFSFTDVFGTNTPVASIVRNQRRTRNIGDRSFWRMFIAIENIVDAYAESAGRQL
jgi:hypothetical protein